MVMLSGVFLFIWALGWASLQVMNGMDRWIDETATRMAHGGAVFDESSTELYPKDALDDIELAVKETYSRIKDAYRKKAPVCRVFAGDSTDALDPVGACLHVKDGLCLLSEEVICDSAGWHFGGNGTVCEKVCK